MNQSAIERAAEVLRNARASLQSILGFRSRSIFRGWMAHMRLLKLIRKRVKERALG